MSKKVIIAAIGDIHVGRMDWGPYDELFSEISNKADILVLCGDLTARGLPEEAEQLGEQLRSSRIPVVGVLGNHDHESGKEAQVREILKGHNFSFLDEAPFVLDGVGFVGVKGFGGGFGDKRLTSFGEDEIKAFAREASNQALQLESLLMQLETSQKVVALHYAPIRETVIHEAEEIFPFLGSSHLSEPIDTFKVNLVVHGHAHYGSHEGKTTTGVPVRNVSYPLMQQISPKQPYLLTTIEKNGRIR